MSLEILDKDQLSKEVLEELAKGLFDRVLDILRNNKSFREALVTRFIDNPQGYGINHEPGRVKFFSGGSEYTLNLNRSVGEDRLTLITASEGIEEQITIEVRYGELWQGEGRCSLFGGVKRGEIEQGHISYRKYHWQGESPSFMFVNNPDAYEKTSKFLLRI